MHFSKTYAQILLSLPPDLRNNAISYGQLKKLINQLVRELSVLGLTPSVLHNLLEQGHDALQQVEGSSSVCLVVDSASPFKVEYEVTGDSGHLEPHLRVSVADFNSLEPLTSLFSRFTTPSSSSSTLVTESRQELIIPLASDVAFFDLLTNTIERLSIYLQVVHSDFTSTLNSLSASISQHARPMSSSAASHFHPFSQSSDPGAIGVPSINSFLRPHLKSDLYLWRQFFQLYVEAEVFESMNEQDRGERSVEEAQKRLLQFLDRVHESDIFQGINLKKKESQRDIETFIRLNVFILDVKKFHQANTEATRKILKKHSKRTALPLPSSLPFEMTAAVGTLRVPQDGPTSSQLIRVGGVSLPRILVQAIVEVLLPIIPHIDDYSCLICTSIAFKPIRLGCGHLFCVRCLVKLQKRGTGNCPMCRAQTVLTADRTNVDWALLNFMRDWFPVESRAKLLSNEREATKEQAEELGMSDGCIVA